MDESPLHLSCERWTHVMKSTIVPIIHKYFDNLYQDATDIEKREKLFHRDDFVDGLFQKWCRRIEDGWTDKERNYQIAAIIAKYPKFDKLISKVLNANLMVMSIFRKSGVKVAAPKVEIPQFVQTCYWIVSRDVAFPYYIYFNQRVSVDKRPKYHHKARTLIGEAIETTIVTLLKPYLDMLEEKIKKKKKKRKAQRIKSIEELTRENIARLNEQSNSEKVKRIEEFQKSLEEPCVYPPKHEDPTPRSAIDDIGFDDSASQVYLKSRQVDITPSPSPVKQEEPEPVQKSQDVPVIPLPTDSRKPIRDLISQEPIKSTPLVENKPADIKSAPVRKLIIKKPIKLPPKKLLLPVRKLTPLVLQKPVSIEQSVESSPPKLNLSKNHLAEPVQSNLRDTRDALDEKSKDEVEEKNEDAVDEKSKDVVEDKSKDAVDEKSKDAVDKELEDAENSDNSEDSVSDLSDDLSTYTDNDI